MKQLLLAIAIAVAIVLPAFADDKHHGQGMTEAEVRKVDRDAGKVTLKHGEIANLEMPPMTMVFRVKEAAMLDAVKVGDKVSFQAEKINGQYVVTEIRRNQ